MPISGPVVHQQLMDAYAHLQTQLEQSRANPASQQLREQLEGDRSDAVVRLAEHYLPELTPEAVRQTWDEIRPTVARVMLRKEQHTTELHAKLDQLNGSRVAKEQELVEADRQLDASLEAQEELTDQLEAKLREDASFVELSDRAAVAEAALERAEANLVEISADAEKKLPAYEESSLFSYLKERGFGTGEYKKRGFTRRMDRWLSKMIDYQKSKQSYDFLVQTPDRMRGIIEDDRDALNTVLDELERRRDMVAEEIGLTAKIKEAQDLTGAREGLVAELDRIIQETNETEYELNEADDTRGPHYREAIEVFRDMLLRSDSRELKRRAQRTLDITDDQIVASLIGLESEIGELENQTHRRRRELDRLGKFLEDLGRLIQRFRAAQFDSARSQFVGSLSVYDDVQRAQEANDIDELWERIRSAQRWGPTAMERVTSIATHPLTQVLINAMAHAAGSAMEAHARRAGHRRRDRGNWGGGSWSWDSSGGWKRHS